MSERTRLPNRRRQETVELEFGEHQYAVSVGFDAAGAIRALDVLTGRQQWEFMLHSPPWAGVMATAGGLVFGGSNEGNVFALDAETGRPLWDFQSGGAVRTNPISFAIDGKQRIVTTGGGTMFVFGLE